MYNQFTGGAWQLTETGEGNYVLYHIFATTGKTNQIYSVMGQNEYTTLPAAREGAQEEISSLLLGNLPSPEIRPIATVIFQTDKDYGNTINARMITSTGEPMTFRGVWLLPTTVLLRVLRTMTIFSTR
jgi:hypothetical protein